MTVTRPTQMAVTATRAVAVTGMGRRARDGDGALCAWR